MKPLNPLSGRPSIQLCRNALAQVADEVGASFGAVYLRDDRDPLLFRPVCTRRWPQRQARFLGDMRVRIGLGPTGESARSGRGVAVADVFSDPERRDWRLPASELGFVAVAAEPFFGRGGVAGTLSLYFAGPRRLDRGQREMLRSVASRISATLDAGPGSHRA